MQSARQDSADATPLKPPRFQARPAPVAGDRSDRPPLIVGEQSRETSAIDASECREDGPRVRAPDPYWQGWFKDNFYDADTIEIEEGEPVFPARIRRFDIVCEGDVQVLGDPFPPELHQSPAPSAVPWHERYRLSVDLDAMQVCDPSCRDEAPSPIVAADGDLILLYDRTHPDSGVRHWLRRSDGFYCDRSRQYTRIDEGTGYCRRAPFTPFPEREPDTPLTDKPSS